MFAASKSGSADAKDANFKNVTMLLHGNGTNGGQNNTFLDSSTNNFTITRNGNTTQGTFSPYGSNWSNYFDGSGDYLSVADANALDFAGDFTVEAWVFVPTTSASARTIIHKADTNVGYALVMIAAGNIEVQCTSLQFNSTSTLPLNQWNHVAMVRNGSGTNNVKFYLNGVLDGQGTNTTDTASTVTLGIGAVARSGAAGVNPLNGYISNVRTVASAVYTSAFTPSTTPLTAITNTSLLTCQSNRFIDNSTNNFTITKNGDTSVQRFSPFAPSTAYSTSVIGGSGYFDGSGDYLTIPSSSTFSFTGDFTWEAWVYLPATTTGCEIVSKHLAGVTGWYMLEINSSLNVNFVIWNSVNASSNAVSTNPLVVGTWNHVAGGRNGSTVFCCLNGIYTSASLTVTPRTTDNSVNIGMNLNGSSSAVKGYISNLRCVTSAVYTANYTVPTAPLTAISNTQLLLSTTNASIFDNAMMNDLETVGNAQISTSVKKYGTGSMYFDGTGDYLKTPSLPILSFGAGNFTIEMWVYQAGNRVQSYPTLIGNNTTWAANYWDICLDRVDSAGKITVWINNVNSGSATITGTTSLSQNTWYHIALVRNGTSLTLYLNGTSDGSASISTTAIDNNNSNFSIIGSQGSGTEFSGYIDDLRITKGVARYTSNFTAPTAPFPDKG